AESATAQLLDDASVRTLPTAHGPVRVREGRLGDVQTFVLPRSGPRHPLPAHSIDFKENMALLAELGVTDVVSTGMVGSLRGSLPVGSVVVLDQFLDFTKHRDWTYFEDTRFGFGDFTEPFCSRLREGLVKACAEAGIPAVPNGCYVGVDGPRFETSAEVRMYGMLGGDVIGMTVLPECVMAREAGLCYATVAGVVNLGAGLAPGPLHAPDFLNTRQAHMERMKDILRHLSCLLSAPDAAQSCACPTVPMERTS
ncbi:MTAP family purine nucleoside phosphorylase, partial [Streptomyces sp. NPDC051976]|uniref:MTAP family purine nucleoside phosphorylase n=1 Tax=Streptomyces sp. NPDC051976 TaxID=3154947 RepID=UPI00343FA9C9